MRMEELERREEVFWHQRSRQSWIESGDKNTTFFHQKANQREQRNRVNKIKNEVGICFEEEEEIIKCFANNFEQLCSSNNEGDVAPVVDLVEPLINAELGAMLAAPFRRDEIIFALSQMHPNKAPGPDGMNALFYQSFWHKIGEDVIDQNYESVELCGGYRGNKPDSYCPYS